MQVVIHAGAHMTDEDRLIACLRDNTATLAPRGTHVPDPESYRRLLRDVMHTAQKTALPEDARELLRAGAEDEFDDERPRADDGQDEQGDAHDRGDHRGFAHEDPRPLAHEDEVEDEDDGDDDRPDLGLRHQRSSMFSRPWMSPV